MSKIYHSLLLMSDHSLVFISGVAVEKLEGPTSYSFPSTV
jgi:hypothetical protein